MKHLSEEDLVLLYYGERGVSGEHLEECAACRSAAAALAQTLNLCDGWVVPEPAPDFGKSMWAQLAPQLEGRKFRFSIRWKVAYTLLATAALLIAAFVAGRVSSPKTPVILTGLSKQARTRILEISLADHLDRAGMLLTEISNTSYSGSDEFSFERTRAQDMVEEGRLMRQSLAAQGQSATLPLLDEVERFMLEVANSPEHITQRQIGQFQERIGAESLIFKVQVISTNLRTEGKKS